MTQTTNPAQSEQSPLVTIPNITPAFGIVLVRYFPALVAVVFLGMTLPNTYNRAVALNNGTFTYALDDAYIHMSIAENLVHDGMWGITRYAFSSSTSSPLWTLILAFFYTVFGVQDMTPLWMTMCSTIVLLFVVNHLLLKLRMPSLFILAVLWWMIHFLAVEPLVFSGMEHILHILLIIVFIYHAANLVARPEPLNPNSRDAGLLWLLGAASVMTRYESVALIGLFGLLFILRRRLLTAILLGLFNFTPPVIYGLISMGNGWHFLPPSILHNTTADDILRLPRHLALNYMQYDLPLDRLLLERPVMLWLLIATVVLFICRYALRRTLWDSRIIMLMVFAGALGLHVRFVQSHGTLYRYEMYIIALGIFVLAAAISDWLPRRPSLSDVPLAAAVFIAGIFLIIPWNARLTRLNQGYPVDRSMHNIYLQQYQMAQFIRTYYDGQTIAANDIGAITYYNDIRLLDLVGLGTWDFAQARIEGYFHEAIVDYLTNEAGATIAILYDSWFAGDIPESWIKVGTWSVQPPYVLGGTHVSFYAVRRSEYEHLRRSLVEFSEQLPSEVKQEGDYTEPRPLLLPNI